MRRPGSELTRAICTAAIMALAAGAFAQEREPQGSDEDKAERAHEKYCESLPEAKRRKTESCKTEDERREDAYQKVLKEREDREKPQHTSFLRWLHLDTLWMPTTFGGSPIGLVGSHITVANLERLNFYGPPGVILLLEDVGGERKIRPALTWGISVYLFDMPMPGENLKKAQVYLNVTKVWVAGSYESGFDMAGISMTWKK